MYMYVHICDIYIYIYGVHQSNGNMYIYGEPIYIYSKPMFSRQKQEGREGGRQVTMGDAGGLECDADLEQVQRDRVHQRLIGFLVLGYSKDCSGFCG